MLVPINVGDDLRAMRDKIHRGADEIYVNVLMFLTVCTQASTVRDILQDLGVTGQDSQAVERFYDLAGLLPDEMLAIEGLIRKRMINKQDVVLGCGICEVVLALAYTALDVHRHSPQALASELKQISSELQELVNQTYSLEEIRQILSSEYGCWAERCSSFDFSASPSLGQLLDIDKSVVSAPNSEATALDSGSCSLFEDYQDIVNAIPRDIEDRGELVRVIIYLANRPLLGSADGTWASALEFHKFCRIIHNMCVKEQGGDASLVHGVSVDVIAGTEDHQDKLDLLFPCAICQQDVAYHSAVLSIAKGGKRIKANTKFNLEDAKHYCKCIREKYWADHHLGQCKPCVDWHSKSHCRKELACNFCHFDHQMRELPARLQKKERELQAETLKLKKRDEELEAENATLEKKMHELEAAIAVPRKRKPLSRRELACNFYNFERQVRELPVRLQKKERELEAENAKLRKKVYEREAENAMLKETVQELETEITLPSDGNSQSRNIFNVFDSEDVSELPAQTHRKEQELDAENSKLEKKAQEYKGEMGIPRDMQGYDELRQNLLYLANRPLPGSANDIWASAREFGDLSRATQKMCVKEQRQRRLLRSK